MIKVKPFFFLLFFLLTAFLLEAQDVFFWERPEPFSSSSGSFPVSAYNADFSVLLWQEADKRPANEGGTAEGGSIRIALAVKERGEDWEQRGIVGGPYSYSGSEPSIRAR